MPIYFQWKHIDSADHTSKNSHTVQQQCRHNTYGNEVLLSMVAVAIAMPLLSVSAVVGVSSTGFVERYYSCYRLSTGKAKERERGDGVFLH